MVSVLCRRLPSFAAFALLITAACGDDPESWEPGRPRIDRLTLLQQTPGEPLALEVQLAFVDSDGDLGGGALRLMLNSEPAGERSMLEVFQQQSPELPANATEGELEIVVRLSESAANGDAIRVGVVIEDRQGRESNDPYFEIKAF